MDNDEAMELLTGLVLGAIGLALLAEILKPKCPVCKAEIPKNAVICNSCRTPLRWR
ncbi:MAG: hypothetical protein V1676_00100 [Candidatus Diapherotrites archaeon]